MKTALIAAALLLSATMPAAAQQAPAGIEQAVISGLQSNGVPNGTIENIRVFDGYAIATVAVGDSKASAYLSQVGNAWQYLHLSGGAPSAKEISGYGIPSDVTAHLLSGAGSHNFRVHREFGSGGAPNTANSGGVIPLGTGSEALRDYCQRYLQSKHIGSYTVLAARQSGAYAICQVVGLEDGGQILMRYSARRWHGLGFVEGVFDYVTLVHRYHVPAQTIAAFGYPQR